jgi:hypothetical protein
MSGTSHFGPGPREKKKFRPGPGEKKILVPVLAGKSFRSRSRSLQKQILVPVPVKNILVTVPVKKNILVPGPGPLCPSLVGYLSDFRLLALRCIEREDKQCHRSYVTERRKNHPSWDSNYTPSAIRADVLSQLD